jgi:excisionase family DNA binding protein
MEQLLVGLSEAGHGLGVSRSTVKRLIGAGELEKVTIGRRTLIPVASIEEYYVRRVEESRVGGADLAYVSPISAPDSS